MLTCQKHLFSLPDEVAYLNCAYMSPNAEPVELTGYHAVAKKNLPFEITVPDFFEPVAKLKQLFARLIHAADPERAAVIPSVSYGMASVVKNAKVKPGQNIVMAGEVFPSNYYAWKRLADENGAEIRLVHAPAFPIPAGHSRGEIWNRNLLEAIDDQTVAAALPHVHWADGTRFDLEAVRRKTHEVGALLVVDGTQSVGALPFDMRKIQPDALVCAGYKWMLGPYGLGLAWYGEYFDGGAPIEENWINRLGSEDFQGLVNYQSAYRPKANRYSMGENSQFIGVPMLSAALELIQEWGVENIQEYAVKLSQPYFEQFEKMGCWIEVPHQRSGHLAGLRLPEGVNLEGLKTAVAEAGVFVSFRGNAVRVSTHVFNNEEDFERLAGVLKDFLIK
jgi:selenocysteine lyase/cysteine desulfurase